MKPLFAAISLIFSLGISDQGLAQEIAELEKIRDGKNLPALGVIAIVDGKVGTPQVTGLRKTKGGEAVTTDDKWHIGSCTKSMTATLAATFVERGEATWETTVGEILGESIEIPEKARGITLYLLITNRGGIPGSAPSKIWSEAWKTNQKPELVERRLKYVEAMLNEKLEFKPGSKYAYSNSGFVVAGAMLEKISGKSWEELMKERIFAPLKMESAGFGGAATKGKEDQPWGHHSPKKPQAPGPGDDNPDVIGPAGTVHASLEDLARFVKMHLLQETGPVLKKQETFALLQTVAEDNDGDYGGGWIVTKRPWAKGVALTHAGSNTMNFCVIWMAPKRKFAAIAVTNMGGDSAFGACDAAVGAQIKALLE